MKKADLIYTVLLVPLDYLAIVVSALVAYQLRFQTVFTDLRPVLFQLPLIDYLKIVLVMAVGWVIIFALNGLYSFKNKSLLLEYSRSFSACSTSILIIMVAFFFNTQLFNSRLIILLVWVFSIVFVSLFRTIARIVRRLMYSSSQLRQRVILFGTDRSAEAVADYFIHKQTLGYDLINHFKSLSDDDKSKIEAMAKNREIDMLVIATKNISADVDWLMSVCVDYNIPYAYAASMLKFNSPNFNYLTIAGLPFIEVVRTSLDGWGRIYKRFFDIVFSLLALLFIVPLGLIIGLLIKLETPGPVLVRLKRVGKQGKVFSLLKFRSMINNAHDLKKQLVQYNQRQDGPLFKYDNDPRVTKIGRWLRKLSLDELPQFYNVLVGEMSVVGPRPHEPEEVSKYQSHQKQLLAIRPGITGMAQVSGRSDLSFDEEVNLDIYYIEHWRPIQDIIIIIKTPWAMFAPRKAA